MKVRCLSFTALALVFAGPGFAATQGSASTTSSSGSLNVSMQGPAAPRQVQVLGISDVTVTNGSRSDLDANRPGFSMAFCLVDTYGGAVRLSASTANGGYNQGDGFGWRALHSSGAYTIYRVKFSDAAVTGVFGESNMDPTFTINLDASYVVTNASACGSGNVKIHGTVYSGPMPETLPARTYTDVITLTVTPQ